MYMIAISAPKILGDWQNEGPCNSIISVFASVFQLNLAIFPVFQLNLPIFPVFQLNSNRKQVFGTYKNINLGIYS